MLKCLSWRNDIKEAKPASTHFSLHTFHFYKSSVDIKWNLFAGGDYESERLN